jgi:hypothetical protein
MVPYRAWEYWRRGVGKRLKVLWFTAPPLAAGMLAWLRDNATPAIQHYLLWIPSLRWYWHWYLLALLVSSIIIIIIAAPAANRELLKDQRRRHINSFREFKARNEKPPVIIVQGTPDAPNLLVLPDDDVRTYRNEAGVVFERDAGEESETDFYTATANVKNAVTTSRKVGDALGLSARISIRPFDDSHETVLIDQGAWLREPSGKVNIPRNYVRELVIVTVENGTVYAMKHLASPNENRVTKRLAIPDGPANIHIRLRTESGDNIIRRVHLILERTTDTASGVKLTNAARWRLEQITAFIDEALILARSTATGEDEVGLMAQFEDWQSRVVGFLSERWDAQHAETFRPAKKATDGASEPRFAVALRRALEPSSFIDKLLAKIKILQRFQDELTREMLKEYA